MYYSNTDYRAWLTARGKIKCTVHGVRPVYRCQILTATWLFSNLVKRRLDNRDVTKSSAIPIT